MAKIVVAYVPVLHQGYFGFFKTHSDAGVIYVLDRSVLTVADWLRKDIRALMPDLAVTGIRSWNLGPSITLVSVAQLPELIRDNDEIIMPDEDVSHALADKYWPGRTISYDPVFLRWDRRRSNEKDAVNPDHAVTEAEIDKLFMLKAAAEITKASNIWRRVGAALVKDGQLLGVSSNRQQPTDHSSWIDGDVRMNFDRGVGIEMSTDMHAEPMLIGEAAKRGRPLDGAELYVTTFPCPPCAMLIAHSGIKKVYYAEGYAVLDGERVLKANGVELIKVNVELPPDRADVYRPYPEK